jgi:hypothetical protein
MKKLLLSFLLIGLVSFYSSVQAQSCAVSDLIIQNVTLVPGTTCTYTFDVAFTVTSNNTRYVYFQSYLETQPGTANPMPYPDNFDCDGGTTGPGAVQAPLSAAIGTPFLNITIDNSGATPVLATTYLPDPTEPIVGVVPGTTINVAALPGGATRFNLFGLQVTLLEPLCSSGEPFVLVTDFFATNSGNPSIIQCVSCNVRAAVGFFTITSSLANCATLQFTANLQNNTAAAIGGTYEVFADVNGNGLLTPGVDVDISSGTPTFSIAAGTTSTTQLTGPIPVQYGGLDLILVTTLTTGFASGSSSGDLIAASECAALPVRFKSFNAARKNQDVLLSWETASEDNNRGFSVQRNIGRGWLDLEFVASKAGDGNSSSVLAYDFTDRNNTTKGVSQYRIMQVDIDGKSKLSEVRLVRGLNQGGKTIVYPNPSNDGQVNVVFEESKATWDVFVSDMSGRTIRQFKGVTNNVLVDKLLPGMYMIRMVAVQTGVQTNEKVVVNNW